MTSTRRAIGALTSIFVLGLFSTAAAQGLYSVETRPARGFMPTADQLAGPVDSIDPVSGKLHLEIPLASVPKTRGGLGLDLNLTYDSHLFDVLPDVFTYSPTPTSSPQTAYSYDLDLLNFNGGWAYGFNYALEGEDRRGLDLSQYCGASEEVRAYRYRIRLPDGSLHLLHLKPPDTNPAWTAGYEGDGFTWITASGRRSDCGAKWNWPWVASNTLLTYYTSDGSYLKLETIASLGDWRTQLWRLYFPDGRRVDGIGYQAQTLYDANGNAISIRNVLDAEGYPQVAICRPAAVACDGTNNDILIKYNVTHVDQWQQGIEKRDQIVGKGPNGAITWSIDWQVVFLNGAVSGRKYRRADVGPEQFRSLSFGYWAVKSVQLPLAAPVALGAAPPIWNSYAFDYSGDSTLGYGELNMLRVPTGAQYAYQYRFDGAPCDLTPYTGQCPPTLDIAPYNWITRKTITHDGMTDLVWTYAIDRNQNKSTVTPPDGGQTTYWFGVPDSMGDVVYRIDEPNGSVRKRVWAQNKAGYLTGGLVKNPNNPYIQRETVTVGNAAGTPTKTAVTDDVYDKNGNRTERREYDWVNYIASASPYSYNAALVETGAVRKRVETQNYWVAARPATDTGNDPRGYWQANAALGLPDGGARRLNAVQMRSLSADGNWNNSYAATQFFYDDPFTKGNLTSEQRWYAPGAGTPAAVGSLTWTRAYDAYGNVTDITEPADSGEPVRRTHITYDGAAEFPVDVYSAYQTAVQRHWQYQWNSSAGVINSKKDVDNNLTTTYAYDTVGRQTRMDEAGLRRVLTEYADAGRQVTVKRDLRSFSDGLLQTVTHYDELGRVRLARASDGANLNPAAEDDGIKIKTVHRMRSGGACTVTSTPYRSTSDGTLEWQQTEFDRLGRVIAVSMFTGPEPNCQTTANRTGLTQTQYDIDTVSGLPRVRVIDPAGKIRDEERDALGRLTRVIEDPSGSNDLTQYAYDALDNLIQVTQGTQPPRAFSYDTLGRLRQAVNPESGTATYAYYASGDLRTRTDARPVTTTFTYDELHRIRTKSYTDPTPQVTYEYFLAGAPNIGQLQTVRSTDVASSTVVASTAYNAYDGLGRVTSSTHAVNGLNGGPYPFQYQWFLNDGLLQVTHPSGRTIKYDVDNAGRVGKVYVPSIRSYADLMAYAADGRLAQMQLGNQRYETHDYRPPGTPAVYALGTAPGGSDIFRLEYSFNGTGNNGNVLSQKIVNNGMTWIQNFEYDGLNRLSRAWEAGGGFDRTYGYDRYGNRWVSASSGLATADIHEPTVATNFNAATNRLVGPNYDDAGNQTSYAPYTLAYDGENRNTAVTSADNGNLSFVYDGEGRRVMKKWTPSGGASIWTYYVYNALGQLAAEYSTQPGSTSTSYPFADMLGSVRAVTDSSGSLAECYDYLPFGRLLVQADHQRPACYPSSVQPSSKLPQKFTGKERDVETGLDNFFARFYSGAQGRFTSADLPLIDQNPSDPQSWNLYSYVRNNPLKYIDPAGQDCIYTDDIDSNGTVSVEQGNCSRKRGTFVNGTIDVNSLTWDSRKRSLGYGYSGSENTIGTGVIGVSRPPSDELDAKGLAFVTGMAARVDASNEMIATLAGLSTAAGIGAGAYPYAAQLVNETAFGPAMGRLFFEGKAGFDVAAAFGVGRVIANSPIGEQYLKLGQPLGTFGWQLLSRFWASGAAGSVNIFPSFTRPESLLWRTELPVLLSNPNVIRFWR